MMVSLLIILPFAAALVLLSVPAVHRVRQRPAFRPQAPAETRYAVTVLPDPDPEREPFAAGSVLVIGDRP